MKLYQVLLGTCVPFVLGSQRVFSVHDDLLAFPQYEILFSESYISDDDADSALAYASSSSSARARATSLSPQDRDTELLRRVDSGARAGRVAEDGYEYDESAETYESMVCSGRRYLCSIPIVKALDKNSTAAQTSQAEAEEELSRATARGWELLKEMEGSCMYFVYGWWTYSFCYNEEVKQFHQQPTLKGISSYPPVEDRTTPSYILGRVKKPDNQKRINKADSQAPEGAGDLATTELQAKGEMRYLVQKLRGGTVCDLTGKERKIEVQFHCHPQSADKIGFIKEVSTCSYLMVIYTPRLCNDVTFLPPRESKANAITCREIVLSNDVADWKIRKASERERRLLQDVAKERIIVGGVEVGAAVNVGKEGKRIFDGHKGVDIVASGAGTANGGKVQMLSDETLRKLGLDPKVIEELREQLQKLAGDKGWKLEVFDTADGGRDIRGVLDPDPAETSDFEAEEQGDVEDGEGEKGEERGSRENEEREGKQWVPRDEL